MIYLTGLAISIMGTVIMIIGTPLEETKIHRRIRYLGLLIVMVGVGVSASDQDNI